ncbi:MAG: imidazoleglycerol-phosphate dehydratase HisB [Verrucomicrobiae bacterium]|nr:imidazoleglycerol-phosphate dehydratase HisB [Verrucomicrobiae bacterium]
MSQPRAATVHRKTGETDVKISVGLDGTGTASIGTGVPFLDHMLHLFAKHSRIDLDVVTVGDIEVDFHHTVEDTGIVLGQAIREALGEKRGIVRYGFSFLPMDETLARVVVDFSGRPFLEYRAPQGVDSIGGNFTFTLVEEFLRAFAFNALINLHAEILYGRDGHHMSEAIFKGLARSVDAAIRIDARIAGDVPSTKDVL